MGKGVRVHFGSAALVMASSAGAAIVQAAVVTIVFVHGAGRGGKDAWPAQQGLIDETAATWLDWPDASGGDMSAPRDLMTDQVETLLAHVDEPIDVVAHSHGAVAALLAAQRTEALVQNLVLFEPACFSLARGQVAVEAHIDVMDPVLSRAADPQLNDLQYAALSVSYTHLTLPTILLV